MTTTRTQIAETLREKTRGMAEKSVGDDEAAVKMLAYVQAETARTELERHGVSDVAWMMIDSETDWKMHKKLACLKYIWTITITMEYRALTRLDTTAIRELMNQAGDGYDRHLTAKPARRRGGRSGRVSQSVLRSARAG